MRKIFFGMGKVNSALSRVIDSDCLSFEEDLGSQTVLVKSKHQRGVWQEQARLKGDFDQIDFSSYLPADVFISPGIDPRRKFFQKLKQFEIRELDFFCSKFKAWTLAVTGTDGKSTLTTQLGEVLRRAFPEQKIFVGGNLGNAMAEALESPHDGAVLEISSFQAERLKTCQLDFGVLVNLAADHLDRYDSLEDYFAAKWHLMSRAKIAICPRELEVPQGLKVLQMYSNEASLSEILEQISPLIVEKLSGSSKTWNPDWLLNLPRLPHRLEIYGDSHTHFFVDDSKATSVHATRYGLRLLQERFSRIRLIVGGRHKGDDFGEIAEILRSQDELLICGEARELIKDQVSMFPVRLKSFKSLSELLEKELQMLAPHDCLALSPACSSYDEFKNFVARAEFFLSKVKSVWGALEKIA